MKAYTDLEQSKKLAEFLPLESADMMYHSVENEYGNGAFVAASKVITNGLENDDFYIDDIPCWSLAALLKMLKDYQLFSNGLIVYIDNESYKIDSDNPINACYEMIIKLNELKML